MSITQKFAFMLVSIIFLALAANQNAFAFPSNRPDSSGMVERELLSKPTVKIDPRRGAPFVSLKKRELASNAANKAKIWGRSESTVDNRRPKRPKHCAPNRPADKPEPAPEYPLPPTEPADDPPESYLVERELVPNDANKVSLQARSEDVSDNHHPRRPKCGVPKPPPYKPEPSPSYPPKDDPPKDHKPPKYPSPPDEPSPPKYPSSPEHPSPPDYPTPPATEPY
eukprot:GHVU01063681.1.p1 GENE.GHVU01063681.1~~GHVU01063681.1.p1  ORF type:complete len:225 (+),score=18.13 GHVU01063681.1:65-739(+)